MPKPTLCYSTLGSIHLELEEALRFARGNGLETIELRGLGGHLDLPAYFEARFGTPARLVECFADHGVAAAAMDTSVRIIEAGEGERLNLTALRPWALAARAPSIRVFDGGSTGSVAELAAIGPLLAWWQEQGAGP